MRVSLSPREFKELLLSHHPNLPCFKDDVIIIFGRRICAGCLLGYPPAFFVLILLQPSGIASIALALLLAIISQVRRIYTNYKAQQICRVVAGFALGFGIGGGHWAIINGQWLAVFFLGFGAIIYTFSRAYSIKTKLREYQHLF